MNSVLGKPCKPTEKKFNQIKTGIEIVIKTAKLLLDVEYSIRDVLGCNSGTL